MSDHWNEAFDNDLDRPFNDDRGDRMNDDNWNDEIDNDFDSLSGDFEEYVTELDAYVEEVNNKEWINKLISGINLEDL